MKLYQTNVGNQVATDGVGTYTVEAAVVEVDGNRFAAIGDDYCCRADPARGWSESRADSMRFAADKIAEMARVLLAQAERLREEADGVSA